MSVTTKHPAQPKAPEPASPPRARIRARRRRINGVTLGGIPAANVVLIEVGLAIGFGLFLINQMLWPVSIGIAALAIVIALLRRRGRWFTQWLGLVLEYQFRNHLRSVEPPDLSDLDSTVEDKNGDGVISPEENHRVALLRLVVDDLVIARTQDHDRNDVGLAWHNGKWTGVLLVETTKGMLNPVNSSPNLPLSVLAPCLEDRGVVLDAIQVIWHCYPGSAALLSNPAALNSYLELLGPQGTAARRTTWVTVRLDPQQCAKAIGERGGGVLGAHRALIGAMSRVRNALEQQGIPSRPLDPDELLQAGISSAELQSVLRSQWQKPVGLKESWDSVAAGEVGHTSYAITGWPSQLGNSLNALTGIRALSTSIAMSISPVGEEGEVGLRSLVRVSARNQKALDAADKRLKEISTRLGLTLTPLHGSQLAGYAATLPLGGAA